MRTKLPPACRWAPLGAGRHPRTDRTLRPSRTRTRRSKTRFPPCSSQLHTPRQPRSSDHPRRRQCPLRTQSPRHMPHHRRRTDLRRRLSRCMVAWSASSQSVHSQRPTRWLPRRARRPNEVNGFPLVSSYNSVGVPPPFVVQTWFFRQVLHETAPFFCDVSQSQAAFAQPFLFVACVDDRMRGLPYAW